ncbi:GPI inositol-deacylase PGAP1-like protein [Kalmanozyma brasiliensis GHG001]|uniref:GPI inositol-deacylase n=1 Tax=Kalmanozyma brasiliensis (strain GHG001) TaxID=1365824 RepID=V5E393_KALBG|nr:GPI inositol-deacylase PGAP1-like protein [Kalmanozyma brasiliensis GHG001]EST04621.1 GPI inositol-deacylase PGAP1-like protein [Kalmanozyma brasiliensis GHG001]
MSRHARLTWLPWCILAIAVTLANYSLVSFVQLPKQLGISQQCRMSRMRPAYIDHTANLEPFSPSGLWRKYRLYLYRERDFEPMDLPTGSPALFVPGNSGSYGQVRSVASSAARQFYKENGSGARRDEWNDAPPGVAHTDWYTVDFNEDFSAFSGSTLIEQATFINEVVAYLTNRYASPPNLSYAPGERNTTVPILAHSMGGIAARLATHLPDHGVGKIDTIVTLSTPHAYPPVPFDRSLEYVYSLINKPIEAQNTRAGSVRAPPLLVSIAGGLLDTQLPSDPSSLSLARIGESIPASRISTYTGSLPSLWSSVDHLAVMWCDQLREKIARGFLLDMMAFGRVSDERSAGGVSGRLSVLRRRRELWRRALSLFDDADAGNGEIGPLELVVSPESLLEEDSGAFVMDHESPSTQPSQTGPDSALSINNRTTIYRVPAKLGEQDEEVHSFELLTNLCVGWNPSSGMGAPIPQPMELVVQLCSNKQDPGDPVGGLKTSCQSIMPWQWELIPPSLLPRTDILSQETAGQVDLSLAENAPVPSAEQLYHVPGYAFQRLHLDANFLKRQRVDWIRVERKTDQGVFVHQRGLNTFVRAGWVRQASGRVRKYSSSLLLTTAQDTAEQQHHRDAGIATQGAIPIATEWILKDFSSSLLARRIEVVPSKCLVENLARYTLHTGSESLHSTEPSFAPFLHVSDRATGDTRWYPQLVSPDAVRRIRKHTFKYGYITFPLSLHGNAPFMPPARDSITEVKVQLWSDPALLRDVPGQSVACKTPFDPILITIDWKTSAGLVLLRYRFFLAAWPLGILCICVGLSWLSWSLSPEHAFASPLISITQPVFRTPVLHKSDPLLGLLGSLTAALLVMDAARLLLYKSIIDAGTHGPGSSLLGMILGLGHLSSSAALVPCFLLVSYATLFVIVASIQWSFSLIAAVVTKASFARKLDWVGAATASSDPLRWNRQSMIGLTVLLMSVVLFVPHQFVFLCIFLLQLLNTLRALLELRSTRAAPHLDETRYHQHLSIFLILVLLLPQKASFLVTWVRNLASVGLKTPKTMASWMDHNVFDVAPIVILVWLMAGGRTLEPPRTALEAKALAAGFGIVGWYALVWGIRYTYRTYDAFNALCVLLAFCHWRSRRGGSDGALRRSQAQGHGVKNSDETLEMLGHHRRSDDLNEQHGMAEEDSRELRSGSSSERLPIHHLALPASLAIQSDTISSSAVSKPDSTASKDVQHHGDEQAAASVGDDLDRLIAEYLEVLDQYQQVRNTTSDHFSRGFHKLSRAKMEYGASRLSSTSYDSRILPEVRATVVGEPASKSTDVGALNDTPRSTRMLVARVQPDYSHLDGDKGILIGDTGEKDGEREDIAANGLRRRAGGSSNADAAKESEAESSLPNSLRNSSSSPAGSHTNPTVSETRPANSKNDKKDNDRGKPHKAAAKPDALSQFGGLPTTSLRGAQTDLRAALDQSLGVRNGSPGLVQLTLRLEALGEAISNLKGRAAYDL